MRKIVLCFILLLLCNVQLRANSISLIPGLFNTGVDDSGSPLPGLTVDSHYLLVTAPSVITTPSAPFAYADISPVNNVYPGAWVNNTSTSQWIGPNTNIKVQGDPGWDSPPDFTYNLTFSLAGLDPNTADIVGQWATDNESKILINGVDTGIAKSSTGYGSLDSFEINAVNFPTGTFLPGSNTLSFVVTNDPLPAGYSPPIPADRGYSPEFNPTGLQVGGLTGTAVEVPEPASAVLTLLALVGCGLLYRMRLGGSQPGTCRVSV